MARLLSFRKKAFDIPAEPQRYPTGGEGVITLSGVEYCFMYVVQNDVVDTVIGPPDYIEQVFNEGRQDTKEGKCVVPRKDHD